MICTRPLGKGEVYSHGCGQCLPCRLNQVREKAHRCILESYAHQSSTVATLTYAVCPPVPELDPQHFGTLDPSDVCRFVKRLRKALAPQKIRFQLVGEYGDLGLRPHYHCILFGLALPTDHARLSHACPCSACGLVREAWKGPVDEDGRVRGNVYLDALTWESAAYVSGYVVKKVNGKHRPGPSFHPEFGRQSNRPGIGAGAGLAIAASLADSVGQAYLEREKDVPRAIHTLGKKLPLGRYLRNVVRRELGRPEKTPQEALNKRFAEVFAMFEAEGRDAVLQKAETRRQALVTSITTRHRIFKSKGSL